MKKALLTLTALTMSVAVSACSTHDNDHGDMSHNDWSHKEHMNMMAQDYFNLIDKNGDGVISKAEYNEYARQWFKEADVNHDGMLTLAEVKAQMKREKEKMHRMHHDGTMNNDNNMNKDNIGMMNNDNGNTQNYDNQPNNRY